MKIESPAMAPDCCCIFEMIMVSYHARASKIFVFEGFVLILEDQCMKQI